MIVFQAISSLQMAFYENYGWLMEWSRPFLMRPIHFYGVESSILDETHPLLWSGGIHFCSTPIHFYGVESSTFRMEFISKNYSMER